MRYLTKTKVDDLTQEFCKAVDLNYYGYVRDAVRDVILPFFDAVEREPWRDGDIVHGTAEYRSDRAWYVRRDGAWYEIPTASDCTLREYDDEEMDAHVWCGHLVKWEPGS